jgi:polyphosphate kinase
MKGGRYHQLRDLGNLPVKHDGNVYPVQPSLPCIDGHPSQSLYEKIIIRDRLVHPPYHSYDSVLRFFNEAVLDRSVNEIYVTLYRIASDSQIAHALINAAKNNKKVFVVVELKARFDEANNIRWAKSMKAAGVKIVYSENMLKVHAKIALVKRADGLSSVGLLSTGNFNETTAKFYTDHVLLTAHQPILKEMEMVFQLLMKGKKISEAGSLPLQHLLVARFNMYDQFLFLINREIAHAGAGYSSGITIKLNNLEEERLIRKLYEASNAGVRIKLLVRSICCLVPGVAGQSENIVVRRIVDRYLEHGRIFIFQNRGNRSIYLGSSDWMNRNIHHRVEVCFPLLDEGLKSEISEMIDIQWADNSQAVQLDPMLNNVPVNDGAPKVRSQKAIYKYLQQKISRP